MNKTKLLLLIAVLFLAIPVFASVSGYTFVSTGGTFTPLTTYTVSTATGDDGGQNITLPFTFVYDGVSYTTGRISTNGWLEMGQVYTSSGYSNSIGSTSPNRILCPLWDDLYDDATSEVRYATTGSGSTQVFTVEWNQIRWNGSSGTQQTFQVKIYQTTNVIEFIYGTMNAPSGVSASIGMIDATGGSGHYKSVTPGAPSTVSSTTANNTISAITYLTTGTTYTFTPPAALGEPTNYPTNFVAATIPNTSNITLTWTGSVGAILPQSYLIVAKKGLGSYASVADGVPVADDANWGDDNAAKNVTHVVGANSYTFTGLLANTAYDFKIYPYNNGGTDINFKNDGTPPPASATTPSTTVTNLLTTDYVQNFDGVTAPALPFGWTVIDGDAVPTVYWATYATYPQSSPNCMRIGYTPASSPNMNDWFVSPPLQLYTGNNYNVKFYYRAYSSSYFESLALYLGSGATITDLTVNPAIWDNPSFNQTTYTLVSANFTATSNGLYYLGWKCYSAANLYGIHVDDVTISYVAPTPSITVAPSVWDFGIQQKDVAAYKTFAITNGGGSDLLISSLTIPAEFNPSGYYSIDPPVTTMTITPGQVTDNTFRVKYLPGAVNMVSPGYTATVKIVSNAPAKSTKDVGLSGLCQDYTIYSLTPPYVQNFDGVTAPAIPADWTTIHTGTSTAVTYSSSSHSAPNSFQLNNVSDLSPSLMLISPKIDNSIPLSTVRVIFWEMSNYTMQIGTMSDPTNAATYTNITTFTSTSGSWVQRTVALTTAPGANHYIVFSMPTQPYTYDPFYVDDISIQLIPTGPPLAVTLNSPIGGVGGISALPTFSWTPNPDSPPATEYRLYCDTNADPSLLVGSPVASPYTLTAPFQLLYNTTYNWKIVAHNLSGDTACAPQSFITGPDPNFGGGASGTTAGGYYFANNLALGAPSYPGYAWIAPTVPAVTTIPTNGVDDGYWGPIDIGFPFTYYGSTYNQLYINTNGFISFGAGSTSFSNVGIPSAATPNNIIAWFWDDLHFYPASSLYYQGDATKFIITFDNVAAHNSGTYDAAKTLTGQAILFSNGNIKLQYQTINGALSGSTPVWSATVGIENSTGIKGIQYNYLGVGGPLINPGKAVANMAVMFGEAPETLPVELSSFTAVLTDELFVNLNWVVQSETNNLGYNVLRSYDNDLNNSIAVNSAMISTGTAIGTEITYKFTDQEVEMNTNYYYWLENVSLNGESEFYGPVMVTVGQPSEENPTPVVPVVTALLDAYPNPFNPITNLQYVVKDAGAVTIDVYNVRGQLIRSFSANHAKAGHYRFVWNGKDMNGNEVSSGVYFYRMTSGKYSASKKIIMMK